MSDFNELKSIVKGDVLLDVPMNEYTSMQVGGLCACMVTPHDEDDINAFIDWAKRTEQRYFVIGAGTNLIVRDGGIRSPVLRMKGTFDTVEVVSEDESVLRIRAGAGTPLARLVKYGEDNGLSGMEPLAGIPGTTGGAIVMNAGTGHGTISDVVESVTFVERSGKKRTLGKKNIGFGYRTCKELSSSSIVISAVFVFRKADKSAVSKKTADELKEKAQSQPLNFPSSGSIFKNPGKIKAWKLLDEAGMRGVRVRGAKYSELHTNFIVNTGNARAEDVLTLIDAGIEKVKEKTKVKLELEVVIIGEQ